MQAAEPLDSRYVKRRISHHEHPTVFRIHEILKRFGRVLRTNQVFVVDDANDAKPGDRAEGRIDLFFDSIAAGLPYVQSGQVRGIAVLSSKRSPLAPDVPTMSEAGVPGLDVDSWLGIFVPAKTPADIIAKLRTDIRASLPDLKERFEKSGGEVWDLPNDRLDAFVASEYENWTKLIREAGIKLD